MSGDQKPYGLIFVIFLAICVLFILKIFKISEGQRHSEQRALTILQNLQKIDVVHKISLYRPNNQIILDESKSDQAFGEARVPAVLLNVSKKQKELKSELKLTGLVKKTQRSAGKNFEEAIFFSDGKRIASQKVLDGKIVDQKGEIPDGKVKVEDNEQQLTGEEFYRDGKVDGESSLYFANGSIKRIAQYQHGDLQKIKEYYPNGTLRFEADYSDALSLANSKEVGVGKVYFPSGKLKYSWNLTHSLNGGFKKSYDESGTLTHEEFFNEKGEISEKKVGRTAR